MRKALLLGYRGSIGKSLGHRCQITITQTDVSPHGQAGTKGPVLRTTPPAAT